MSILEKMVTAVEETVNQALGINLLDMIIQIAATIILILIVKKFFWGRITEFLDKRKAYMGTELSEAEKANEEAFNLKKTREKELKEIRKKSKDYFETAKTRGEEEKNRIINHAKKEAEVLMVNTQKEIEAEKKKAKQELKSEVVSIAALMTEKMINKKIDEKDFQNITVDNIKGSDEL